VEAWKGFAAQKNSCLAKATCDWILSLDADEEASPEMAQRSKLFCSPADPAVCRLHHEPQKYVLWQVDQTRRLLPDPNSDWSSAVRRSFELRPVHEDLKMQGPQGHLTGDMIHHAYSTLESFIEHSNRYSSFGRADGGRRAQS